MPDIVLPPLINGHRFGYSSIEAFAKIGVRPLQLFLDATDINYSEALEIEFKNGTASVPLGSTRGVWTPQEGSIQMGKSTFQMQVVTAAGPGWLGLNTMFNIAYADIGEPPVVDSIQCRLTGVEDAHSYGPGPLEVVVKFKIVAPIIRNGIGSMLNRVI